MSKNNKLKVYIAGYGYVGKAAEKFFHDHYDVCVYDPLYCVDDTRDISEVDDIINDYTHGKFGLPNLLENDVHFVTKSMIEDCHVVVICVPTPSHDDGSCNLSYVDDVISQCNEKQLIIIKSTVPVGTCDKLKQKTGFRIVHTPEFLSESTYWTPYKFHTDMKEAPFFIFGGDKETCSVCVDLFMPIVGPTKRFIIATAAEAEMAKHIENVFYSMKVTFCYEIKAVCDALNVDYNVVRELWLADPRLNPMHTAVFADSVNAFGGKCFSKDLSSLISQAQAAGYEPELLKEVTASNVRIGELRKPIEVTKKTDTISQEVLDHIYTPVIADDDISELLEKWKRHAFDELTSDDVLKIQKEMRAYEDKILEDAKLAETLSDTNVAKKEDQE